MSRNPGSNFDVTPAERDRHRCPCSNCFRRQNDLATLCRVAQVTRKSHLIVLAASGQLTRQILVPDDLWFIREKSTRSKKVIRVHMANDDITDRFSRRAPNCRTQRFADCERTATIDHEHAGVPDYKSNIGIVAKILRRTIGMRAVMHIVSRRNFLNRKCIRLR